MPILSECPDDEAGKRQWRLMPARIRLATKPAPTALPTDAITPVSSQWFCSFYPQSPRVINTDFTNKKA
jgi:hypothetical protein